jgi:Sep-tRNA:Cys-tRNA synthetase
MSIRIQKTFEALFALEEIRGLFRESLPTGFDPAEETAFLGRIAEVKAILADLEAGTGTPKVTKIAAPGKRRPSTSSRSRPQEG